MITGGKVGFDPMWADLEKAFVENGLTVHDAKLLFVNQINLRYNIA